MNNKKYNVGSIKQTLGGAFKVSVVDANGEVVWEQPEYQKNLILNTGLNQVAYTAYADIMKYGIVGTGTRVNSVYGNTSTVSQTGTKVTLIPDDSFVSFTQSLAGYPGGTMAVGDTIVFDTPENGVSAVQVVGGIDATECTVNKNVNISTTNFTIWKTSQTGLQAEVKRAGSGIINTNLVSGSGLCGSTWNDNVMSMTRTWDFTPEVSPVDYKEVGVGWTSDVGNPGNTFSRLLLPVPVHVDPDQRIRLSYQLQVSVYPTESISRPDASITGWSNTEGSESIQRVVAGTKDSQGRWESTLLSYVIYNGTSYGTATLEPCSIGLDCLFWISTDATPLQSFNTAVDRRTSLKPAFPPITEYLGEVITYKNAYVLNSYTINKSSTYGQANRSQIRSMGFGKGYYTGGSLTENPAHPNNQAFCFVFNNPQETFNTQTLTISYTWKWDRSYVA